MVKKLRGEDPAVVEKLFYFVLAEQPKTQVEPGLTEAAMVQLMVDRHLVCGSRGRQLAFNGAEVDWQKCGVYSLCQAPDDVGDEEKLEDGKFGWVERRHAKVKAGVLVAC